MRNTKKLKSTFLAVTLWDGFFNFQTTSSSGAVRSLLNKEGLPLVSLTSKFFLLFCGADHELNSLNRRSWRLLCICCLRSAGFA